MPELSYRMLNIGGVPAGLLGLNELFLDLFESGWKPGDEKMKEALIDGSKQHNFIPKPAVEDYAEVLLSEYERFYNRLNQGEDAASHDYGQWMGIPREQIPWFPAISAELCNGCVKCIEVCPKDVFAETEDGKVAVIEPFLCIVGCCFCKSACDPMAILMPQKEMLDQYQHGQRQAR